MGVAVLLAGDLALGDLLDQLGGAERDRRRRELEPLDLPVQGGDVPVQLVGERPGARVREVFLGKPNTDGKGGSGKPGQHLLGDLGGELDRMAVGHDLQLGHPQGGVLAGRGQEPVDVGQGRPHREHGLGDAVVVAALVLAVGPEHVQLVGDVVRAAPERLQASA